VTRQQCNKRSSKSATMPQLPHNISRIRNRAVTQTFKHSVTDTQIHRYIDTDGNLGAYGCAAANTCSIELKLNLQFYALQLTPFSLPCGKPHHECHLTCSPAPFFCSVFILFTLGSKVARHGYELGLQKVMPSCCRI